MTLIYPEGGARSFAYNRDLSRFVDRHISKMVTETAVPKSALLDVLWKNKETFTGDRVEWAVFKGETAYASAGANIFFNVFNATTDAVTATETDAYLMCSVDPRNAGRKIKFSKIKLRQASGKEQKVSYIKTSARARVIELMQGLDRAAFNGSPTVSNGSQFSGLNYTIDNGGTHATYAGISRTNSRALIGNELSATATSIAVTSDTGTVLHGRAAITVTSATTSTATNGTIVEVTDSAGNVRWSYADSSNTNIITLANKYEGPTGTVTLRFYSPFTDLNMFGSSGEVTLAKAGKAYSFACDGEEKPNLGVCHNFLWARLRQLVLDTEHSISKSDLNRLGTSGYSNFELLDMPITVAGNAPTNSLYMVNMNHLKLKTLDGFGSMNLTQDGLIPLATTTGSYATLLGEVVVSGEICSSANNRHVVLKNLTV